MKKELQKDVHPLVISWGWESEIPGKSQFLDWHEWQGTRDMSAFLTVPAALKFMNKHNWPEVARRCRKIVINYRNKFVDYLKSGIPLIIILWITYSLTVYFGI